MPVMASSSGRRRQVVRTALGASVTAVAFVAGSCVVHPSPFRQLVAAAFAEPLDRPCAGVTAAPVEAAVGAPDRDVHTEAAGWDWTCRWRSADEATRQRSNPVLVVTARRVGGEGAASPVRRAAKQYGEIAGTQYSSERFFQTVDSRRPAGVHQVTVLDGIGDRAQVYVERPGVGATGHQASLVAVRGDVIVTVRYLSYRAGPADVRAVATRAGRQAVAGR